MLKWTIQILSIRVDIASNMHIFIDDKSFTVHIASTQICKIYFLISLL